MKFNFVAATTAFLAVSSHALAADTTDVVQAALTALMIEKDVESIDTYFAESYIQHNQSVPDGSAGLQGLADAVIANNPAFNYEQVRFFTDGDVAVTHGIYEGFGETPVVAFDVFRVADGKIVEHWDNLAPVAPLNPSGRSQVDGPTQVTDLDKTEANKALIADFLDTVLIGGAFDKLPAYFDGDNYIQHNANIADGLSGLGAGLQALADAGLSLRITDNHMLFGQGNFVLAISEGTVGDQPTAFYDLFRVADGKIAEHWDVIADILPDDAAANGNGKF